MGVVLSPWRGAAAASAAECDLIGFSIALSQLVMQSDGRDLTGRAPSWKWSRVFRRRRIAFSSFHCDCGTIEVTSLYSVFVRLYCQPVDGSTIVTAAAMGNSQSTIYWKICNIIPLSDSSSGWWDSKQKPFEDLQERDQFIRAWPLRLRTLPTLLPHPGDRR